MLPIETEVKFHLSDPSAIRTRLAALGARSLGHNHECNIRLEDEGRNLIRRKCLLRLRRDRKNTLTFKSVPPDGDPSFKQLIEMETEVTDFDATLRILAALGFHPEQTYEKWRETLVVEETTFCLDTLPFGNFLEIEGSREAIIAFAARLNLEWPRRIVLNYLEIFDCLRVHHRLDFRDVTFANFAPHPTRIDSVLHLIEAGSGLPSIA
jgi:adenylate cyclase class 2